MIGIFAWIATSDTGLALVCTRSKAMDRWMTKKDDLFNVGPTRLLDRPSHEG